MSMVLDKTDNYLILDEQHYCCDELQFKYQCRVCEEIMGCYFCTFDYSEPCECQYDMVDSGLFTTKENN